jgi:hypothetical protein
MANKLVKDKFTNYMFKNYELVSPQKRRVTDMRGDYSKTIEAFSDNLIGNKTNWIITNDVKFFKKEIELESLCLALLKVDLKKNSDDIATEFTKKWGFLDFKMDYSNYGQDYPYGPVFRDEIEEVDYIKSYYEKTTLWQLLSFYVHYLFYLRDYSTNQINNIFFENDELPNIFLDERGLNYEISKRVNPELGFTNFKLKNISFETNSLFGAVLMYAIDNYFREIRQCMGPNCRQIFFVKRKGRMFCEPNGRCAKAFERLNKKSKTK